MAWNQADGGNPPTIKVLNAATATGIAVSWPGGRGQCHAVSAGWNGATGTLQRQALDNSTWIAVGTDVTFTANGVGNFELPPCEIRFAITAAVPSAGVSVWVEKITRSG